MLEKYGKKLKNSANGSLGLGIQQPFKKQENDLFIADFKIIKRKIKKKVFFPKRLLITIVRLTA
ncbi:hypothetical protein KHA80_05005 [Anaerobacillus sp. HL2]|nr:hypothetical protein KHA80_05005 [Anaerobacillus sp. HL2]